MSQDVFTFGCRLNAYESEVIKRNLAASNQQNVAVFNSCAVTSEAERQVGQAIRKYKRENPDADIIVTGCAAQIHPEKYADMGEVSQVLGNQEKLEPSSYNFTENTEPVQVNDIMSITETASHFIDAVEGHARAFMQIQNGCNHRCTFCIIPYGRGNSRSVPVAEIVIQAQHLLDNGYQELVLTGVDMTDYGKDLPATPTLGDMIKRLLALVPDLPRIRLSSIDVAEIDDTLMELICHEPRLMPHIHISVQSGDNMILKRMKRRHTREQVIEFVAQVKQHRPDIAIGADIITGFPTEDDAMFENSLKLIEEAHISHLHAFPYSEREGTPAANIPANKQVPKPLRKERAAILRTASEKVKEREMKVLLGSKQQVIIEESKGQKIGRTGQFFTVQMPPTCKTGTLENVMLKTIENLYFYSDVSVSSASHLAI